MTWQAYIEIALYFALLLALVGPLGSYMAKVYRGEPTALSRLVRPLERATYRVAGVSEHEEMSWRRYALAVLLFNLCGLFAVYLLQRVQGALPLNPEGFGSVAPASAWNTAVSFTTNTDWQAYSGETTLSYLTQMLALTVQGFLSAASGMAVLVAVVRGFTRTGSDGVGNFWVDLTRSALHILLPLSLVVALLLVSQGVVQTFSGHQTVALLQSGKEQVVAVGPAASQVAIKQLGTNGGGFFNVNSAHPLENPTPLSGFIELLSILLVPAALTHTFGKMVGDVRQGRVLLAAMLTIFVPLFSFCLWREQAGNPGLRDLQVDQIATALSPGGNMEGKELRFGIAGSALWAAATTAASNGSVNAMHDSFTPLGGLVPMWLIQLGEVVFGGVGSGLYGMLLFSVIAVFIAGLMVGRTPEYLGKKIEAFEMKTACLGILVPCAIVLAFTAIAVVTPSGQRAVSNPGSHGFSQVLYAFSSAANNNGSAFAGLAASSPFYEVLLGIAMVLGRYWVMIPALALAGSLAKKKVVPAGEGTLPTHTPLFAGMLVGVILLVGALTFIPSLALGPIVEEIQAHQ